MTSILYDGFLTKTGFVFMDGLIEFALSLGLEEQTNRASVADSSRGQSILRALTWLKPSAERLRALQELRVCARSCPMSALALGCLFAATKYRRPWRAKRTCRMWLLSVRLSTRRLNLLGEQTSVKYEMALRQTAVESLRLLAIDALELCDRTSAMKYLDMADKFDLPLEDYSALRLNRQSTHGRR